MPRNKQTSLADLTELVRDGLKKASTRPTIHGYRPHDKQIQFHSAQEKGRLLIGGNRSGKTVGGVAEDIYYMRGKHPFRKVPPPPTRGRIVTVSYIEGIKKIIIPEITRWIPPSDLINGSWEDSYSASERTLTLSNGSTVELMSYDQSLEKFAGTSRNWLHFDEEPPKDIYTECKMRLIDTGGSWWITMTPVEGMTWVFDDLYEPGLKSDSGLAVIILDSAENPYISPVELEEVLSGLDINERAARKEGKFVQIGGVAFPEFKDNVHVIPALTEAQLQQIKSWTHYASMDHGLNAPTVWLWHAVSPQGGIITYDEIYDNEKLVHEYASIIHTKNAEPGRRPPDIYVGDPAIRQRNAQTGDSIQTAYAMAGIPILEGNNDQRIGVDKANRYFKQGKAVITENCWNLRRELQRQRWKIYENAKLRRNNPPREELDRKHSHSPDAYRYFITLMPDLYIQPVGLHAVDRVNDIVRAVTSPVTAPVGPLYFDTGLQGQSTQWTTIDEHMGGIW